MRNLNVYSIERPKYFFFRPKKIVKNFFFFLLFCFSFFYTSIFALKRGNDGFPTPVKPSSFLCRFVFFFLWKNPKMLPISDFDILCNTDDCMINWCFGPSIKNPSFDPFVSLIDLQDIVYRTGCICWRIFTRTLFSTSISMATIGEGGTLFKFF